MTHASTPKRYQSIIYKILLPRLALFLKTNCIGSLEPIEIRTIMDPSTPILLIRDCQVDPTCRLFFYDTVGGLTFGDSRPAICAVQSPLP